MKGVPPEKNVIELIFQITLLTIINLLYMSAMKSTDSETK